jgi:hypothetical protein
MSSFVEKFAPWAQRPFPLSLAIATGALMALGIAYTEIRVEDAIDTNEEQQAQLGPIQVAGPCRTAYAFAKGQGASDGEAVTAATRNDECQQQTRLIFETCVRRKLHPACALAEQALRDFQRGRLLGGDAQQTPPASQQPSPPSGGPSPSPPGNPPTPPSNPDPSDPPQGPIGDVLDDVCQITSPLGVCLQ